MSKAERETATRAVVRRLKDVVFRLAREEASRALNHFRENWKRSGRPTEATRKSSEQPARAEAQGETAADRLHAPVPPSPAVHAPPEAVSQSTRAGHQDGGQKARKVKADTDKARAAAKTHRQGAAIKSSEQRMTRQDAEDAGNMIDLNGASREELMMLVGIGPSRAEAIIAGRPYAKPQDLVRRKILPQGILDSIKKQVKAGQ